MKLVCPLAGLVLVGAVALLGTGCSGINTTRSVSPATFLLPGIFGQTPSGDETPRATESVQTVAQAN